MNERDEQSNRQGDQGKPKVDKPDLGEPLVPIEPDGKTRQGQLDARILGGIKQDLEAQSAADKNDEE